MSAGPRLNGGGRILNFVREDMDELSKRFDELHADTLTLPPRKLPVVDELSPTMGNRTLQRFATCRFHLLEALRDSGDPQRVEFAIQAVDQLLTLAHSNPSSELLVHKLQEYQLSDVQKFTFPSSVRILLADAKQA